MEAERNLFKIYLFVFTCEYLWPHMPQYTRGSQRDNMQDSILSVYPVSFKDGTQINSFGICSTNNKNPETEIGV